MKITKANAFQSLKLVEKSVIFRALTPIVFVGSTALYAWSKIQRSALLDEYWDAVIQDATYGTNFEDMTLDRISPQLDLTYQLEPLGAWLAISTGLVLLFWAAWAVSKYAARRGFSQRQYFWLSIVIGPAIPWAVARLSKPNSPLPEERAVHQLPNDENAE